MPPNHKLQKQNIRKQILEQRNQLSQQQIDHSAVSCCEQILQTTILHHAHNIALYIHHKGELNPLPLIEALWRQGKQIFVPVIEESHQLRFVLFEKSSEMKTNQYGIAEPCTSVCCPLDNLDLMFLPLLAFDLKGHRLGMGGGYYDRTLAKLQNKHAVKKVGLAYEFQKFEQLPTDKWDQAMDWIATEQNIYQVINKF